MPLRGLLRRKDKHTEEESASDGRVQELPPHLPTPPVMSPLPNATEFTFMRTTTDAQFIITPPDASEAAAGGSRAGRGRSNSSSQDQQPQQPPVPPVPMEYKEDRKSSEKPAAGGEKRFSERFHLHSRSRSRGTSMTSVELPQNLPAINSVAADTEDEEVQWEKRATLLANAKIHSRGGSSTNLSSDGATQASQLVDVCGFLFMCLYHSRVQSFCHEVGRWGPFVFCFFLDVLYWFSFHAAVFWSAHFSRFLTTRRWTPICKKLSGCTKQAVSPRTEIKPDS